MDIARHALALVDEHHVVAIYPISSGAVATPTVVGSDWAYRKTSGNTVAMLDKVYLLRGDAIRGYVRVPAYPASHGRVRLPIADAAANL